MNTEGTKSTNEWTVAADMMQQDIRTYLLSSRASMMLGASNP